VNVVVTDVNDAALDKGRKSIEGSLARLVKKEALTQAVADDVKARVAFGLHLAAHAKADFVVEAVSENEGSRRRSSRSSTAFARRARSWRRTRRRSASRGCVVHQAARALHRHALHESVPVMKLVEIIRGIRPPTTTPTKPRAASPRSSADHDGVEGHAGLSREPHLDAHESTRRSQRSTKASAAPTTSTSP